ncbi:hypothetical protein CAPTEDRAFT_217706 [Capitella teleta]|uniref:Nerve growth factor-related domain-containing protein n=1 Tax=Capitella teleta TaxID=283909 RepID=X2AMK2_CAPTE|nr:hypothetical protein CAPTEDRAFT_217706 [Capitella teleta]|eukprot:ELU00322.1 hypothetical protein CAPTEDRAFT_217706 [Capitella teleta]
MSEQEGLRRKYTITGLYSQLEEYPGLMERRLHVGSHKPQLPSEVNKRSSLLEVDVASARDINDTEVAVFQPEFGATQAHQWFYTVTCMNDHPAIDRECPGCCIGINHNSYRSQCRQTFSLVYALITRNRGHSFLWAPVQIPSSCNCAITSKNIPLAVPQL